MTRRPRFGRQALEKPPQAVRTDYSTHTRVPLLDGTRRPSMLRGALPETPITTGQQPPDDDAEDPHPGSDSDSAPDEPLPQPSAWWRSAPSLIARLRQNDQRATQDRVGGY